MSESHKNMSKGKIVYYKLLCINTKQPIEILKEYLQCHKQK